MYIKISHLQWKEIYEKCHLKRKNVQNWPILLFPKCIYHSDFIKADRPTSRHFLLYICWPQIKICQNLLNGSKVINILENIYNFEFKLSFKVRVSPANDKEYFEPKNNALKMWFKYCPFYIKKNEFSEILSFWTIGLILTYFTSNWSSLTESTNHYRLFRFG